jgi:hypothetical protein
VTSLEAALSATQGLTCHLEIAGTVRDANLNTPVAGAVLDSYDM